ncbi:CRISPR-associated endonuclease Cas6 [Candidatus Alkanophaga liquidiphilum]
MQVRILVLTIETTKPIKEDGSKLRGFIANKFREYPLLHHHVSEGHIYTYPKVQYKVIEGNAIILGIGEGVEILKRISGEIEELQLGKSAYGVAGVNMMQRRVDFGVSRRSNQYRFITPWLALSPNNYRKYKTIKGWKERKEFLNGILVGNILSMCKGLNYVVRRRLEAHSRLEERVAYYKGIPHIGFAGEFRVNFRMPDFFGLGKGVSQGFGVVKAFK